MFPFTVVLKPGKGNCDLFLTIGDDRKVDPVVRIDNNVVNLAEFLTLRLSHRPIMSLAGTLSPNSPLTVLEKNAAQEQTHNEADDQP